MKKNKRNLFIGILFVLGFWYLAAGSLFGNKFIPTHDGEYHIIRFFEFYTMIADGNIFPRWASGLNSGYGLPLFNFHYPFPNYVGALLHAIGVGFVDSFKMSLGLGFLVSLISCFFVIYKKNSALIAFTVTILFGTVPYWFVDLYIRGSIGEIWAFAFVMIAFASLTWSIPLLFCFAIAGIVLSHNIMAMLFIPIFVLYLLFIRKDWIVFVFLGIGISSYFWLPALVEGRYMTGLNSVTYSDHFPALFQLIIPSWGSGFSGPGINAAEMSQQIGIISLCIFVCAVFYIIKLRKKLWKKNIPEEQYDIVFFSTVFISAFLLMLEVSKPIWNILTPLQLMQYPWRLLSVTSVSLPFIALPFVKKMNVKVITAVVLASIFLSYSYMKPVLYEPRNDEYYLSKKEFTDGTSSLGNSFTTIWTPWKKQRSKSLVDVISGEATISGLTTRTTQDKFTVQAATDSILRINRLYFPGWEVFVDNKPVSIDFLTDGTLVFPLSSGTHTINSRFGSTTIRVVGDLFSIVSSVLVVVLVIRNKKHYAYRN